MKYILLLFCLLPISLKASIFHWKFGIDMNEKSIGDGEHKFKVDDWSCSVGDVKAYKTANTEIRRLGCGIGDGPQASILPSCYKNQQTGKVENDGGVLTLQMKSGTEKTVSLICK